MQHEGFRLEPLVNETAKKENKMKILSRFKYEGKDCYNVAYDDGGYVEPVSVRGLYEEEKIEGLVQAGYKYRDYYGDILTPTGVRISELMESPCTASMKQLQDMKEVEENSSYVLSEAEAARYFDRTIQMEGIVLKEPVEIKFHTREELVEFLQKESRVSGSYMQDIRPLNAITAPEALFTPEELATDDNIKELMQKITERRTLKSLDAYERLVAFLKEHAGLKDDFRPEDLVKAYLAWGVCGLRFCITGIQEKQGVGMSISDRNESATEASKVMDYVGKQTVYALFDGGGNVYTRNRQLNWGEDDDSDVRPASSDDESMYYKSLRTAGAWETKYKSVRAIEKIVGTRVYVDGVSDEGVKVQVKVEPATFAVFVSGEYVMQGKFLRMKALEGEPVFYEADTPEKVALYNLVKAATRKMIQQRTVKCPVRSTVEMLQNAGLSTISCSRYIGRKLEEEGGQPAFLPGNAWRYYRKGPDTELIQGFGVQEDSYETYGDLIELLAAQRDLFEDEGKYPVTKNANEIAPASKDLRVYENPIEQLEFVQGIVDGQTTIGSQEQGRWADAINMEQEIVSLVKAIVLVELDREGQELNITNITNVIRKIFCGELIDIENAIYERNHECKGYLKDQAAFYTDMRRSAIKLIWITKVFREIGNLPADKLRHYMFECIEFPLEKGSRGETAYETLCTAIEEEIVKQCYYTTEQQKILKESVPYYVNNLIFGLIFNKVPRRVEGDTLFITVTVKNIVGEEVKLGVQVPYVQVKCLTDGTYSNGSALRYCTLYDYVTYEFDGRGRQRVYCVNASVSPWFVTPKGGHKINSYNYLVNYYELTAFQKTPDLLREITETGAKVNVIQRSWKQHMLFPDIFEGLQIEYDAENIDTVLDEESTESPYDYYCRWQFKQKEAKASGKLLKRIPLKSDVVWGNFKTKEDNVMPDGIMAEIMESDDTFRGLALKDMRVLGLGQRNKSKELEVGGNKCRLFKVADYEYEDLQRWVALLTCSFTPKRPCFYVGGVLVVLGDNDTQVKVILKEVSREKMDRLVDKGIVYRLDARSYLIRAGEDYVLEVV